MYRNAHFSDLLKVLAVRTYISCETFVLMFNLKYLNLSYLIILEFKCVILYILVTVV